MVHHGAQLICSYFLTNFLLYRRGKQVALMGADKVQVLCFKRPSFLLRCGGPVYVYASYLPLKINHYYASISSCRSGLGGAGNPRSNLSNAALASSAIAVYPSMMSTSANCRIFVMQNLPRAFSITRTLRCGMCIWCWLLAQAHG